MAITYVGSQEDISVTGSPVTISVNIGTRTDGLLIVTISGQVGNTFNISSVTYGGVSMGKFSPFESVGLYMAAIFYLADPPDGTNDLVITYTVDFGSSFSFRHIVAAWFDGALQTQGSVLDQTNYYYEGSITVDPTLDITPTEDGELLISAVSSKINSVLTVGAGETLVQDYDQGGNFMAVSYAVQTTAGTQAMNWTGQDAWAMAVASFRAVAAAPSGNPAYYYQMLNRRR